MEISLRLLWVCAEWSKLSGTLFLKLRGKKAGDTALDLRARPPKAHAARLNEPAGALPGLARRFIEVEADGGAGGADACPGRKIRKVNDRFWIMQPDLAGENRGVLGAGPARND